MDIWNYYRHRERDLRAASASPADIGFEAAPDGRSGRVHGNVTIRADTEVDAYLRVYERVELWGGRFEVVEYSYYLIVNGYERRGWDKDPSHVAQPVHGHVTHLHTRVESDEVTLRQVLERVWAEVAQFEREP